MSMDQQAMSRQQHRLSESQAERNETQPDRPQGRALTLGAAAALIGAPGLEAATFTVTNLDDAGAGSLRQAVLDANAAAGADIIEFQAALSGTITLTTGQIAISDSVSIQGPGAATITVSGNSASRIFYLYSGSSLIDVTVSDLTLSGGGGGVTFGGAIIDFGENLELDNVVITGCAATAGGGAVAATDLSGDGMQFTVRDSNITGNQSGRDGGAVYFYATGGAFTVENSVISGNDAVDDGGGVYLYNITDDLTVTNSTVSGNTADGFGGGIYFYQTDGGAQTVDHSTLSDNSAAYGGALFGVFADTPLTIDHSTLSGNSAGVGGATFNAFVFGSTMGVVNSTVSGNQAANGGGGLFLYGLYAGGTMSVEHTTVAGNSTTAGTGGGLFSNTDAMTVSNSIVADNTPDDLGSGAGNGFNVDFSLIENDGTAVYNNVAGNILDTDPQLGALAPNGGLTLTHKPAAGSPAVNAGDPAFVAPPNTDQRDLPRLANGQIDMGSVELGPAGTIQLSFSAATVGEADGAVVVTATRTGGSEGAVSVALDTADGSAVAPGDYGALVASLLNWADGDTDPKTVNIAIVDDLLVEGDETFTVTLSNATGGAILGAPVGATITVTDNDVAALEPPVPVPAANHWGLAALAALIASAALYRSRRHRGMAAPLIAITLAAGMAAAPDARAEAAKPTPAAQQQKRAVAAPIRQAWVGSIAEVQALSGTLSLRIAGNDRLDAPRDLVEIKDRRGKRLNPDLAPDALSAGQPVIVKVRRNQRGEIQKVRVALFDDLEAAQRAFARRGQ
jgi:hypothetical protein